MIQIQENYPLFQVNIDSGCELQNHSFCGYLQLKLKEIIALSVNEVYLIQSANEPVPILTIILYEIIPLNGPTLYTVFFILSEF